MGDGNKNVIEFHKGFKDDLNKLKKGVLRGKEKPFRTHLNRVLTHLEEYLPVELVRVNEHEPLKNIDTACYSLHLRGKGFNIRFLVKYKCNKYVLLVAFNEIAGKKVSSYEKYIPVMKKRFSEWEEKQNECQK